MVYNGDALSVLKQLVRPISISATTVWTAKSD